MTKWNFFAGIAATASLSMVALPTMIHAEEVNAAHRRLIPKHPNQPVSWPTPTEYSLPKKLYVVTITHFVYANISDCSSPVFFY
jgi:hypothetical protein